MATTRVTNREASTTTTRASAATTTTNTTTPGSMTTTQATSERTSSSSSSSDSSTLPSSISTVAFTINTRPSLTTLTRLAFTGRKGAMTTAISVSLAAEVIALVIVGIIGITIRKKSRSAICKTKVMQTEGQYMDLEPTNSPAPAYESLGTSSVSKVSETKVLQTDGQYMDLEPTNSPAPAYESLGTSSGSKVNDPKVLQPTGHCMDPGSTNSPEPTYESVGAGSVSKVTYENGSVVRVEQLIHLSTAEDEHQYESVEHQ
nr:integumentary mucin C.1-like [Lytechinus pictus]